MEKGFSFGIKRWAWALLWVSWVCHAGNGRFGAPSIESFRALSPEQLTQYEGALPLLFQPGFYSIHGESRGSSFLTSPAGYGELQRITQFIFERIGDYSAIVFVGRSPTRIKTYLEGVLSMHPEMPVHVIDLPYSYSMGRDWYRLSEQEQLDLRQALYGHLTANDLSIEKILAAPKPILFVDFVYSGGGVAFLLEQLHAWLDKDVSPRLRSRIHFLGLYPAGFIAQEHLKDVNRLCAKELACVKGRFDYTDPTPEEIARMVEGMRLPSGDIFDRLCGHVHSFKISADLYHYAGTHGPTAQESFIPQVWAQSFDRTPIGFAGNHISPAFVELYWLIQRGKADGAQFTVRSFPSVFGIKCG